ncbi:MAG TPA: hypothetical protein VFP91_06595 [Vicinamibacterales bacterium]|nr:hypothetical protein [Vicinamibacterales bacterium]
MTTTRRVRSALTASLLTLGVVALAPGTALAQDSSAIPEQGGMITMAGCFVQGQIKDHEAFVLVRPIVGIVASVPEASCAMNVGDVPVKLQNMKSAGLDKGMVGRWIQITGRLEGDHRADGIREVHVKSFIIVPVVAPRAAAMKSPPAAIESPAPVAPHTAEAAPEPPAEPAPVATTGERTELPQTATSLPLVGLIGFLSLSAAFGLFLLERTKTNRG